jgi:hypothetical protein
MRKLAIALILGLAGCATRPTHYIAGMEQVCAARFNDIHARFCALDSQDRAAKKTGKPSPITQEQWSVFPAEAAAATADCKDYPDDIFTCNGR